MKKLIPLTLMVMLTGCNLTPYVSGGFGIKTAEAIRGITVDCKSKISGRASAGVRVDNGFILGIDHHSQPSCGWPVNSKTEYYKTEWFVDYKHEFDWFK